MKDLTKIAVSLLNMYNESLSPKERIKKLDQVIEEIEDVIHTVEIQRICPKERLQRVLKKKEDLDNWVNWLTSEYRV